MGDSQSSSDILIDQAAVGGEQSLAVLFDQHRHRLKQMVRLRLDSSRQDVEETYKLLVETPDGPVDEDQARQRAERWEKITEYFPQSAK